MTKLNYRRMNYSDIESVIPLMEEFFYLSRLPNVSTFDYSRVSRVLHEFVQSDKFFGFIAEADGRIVGVITAHMSPSLFDNGDICSELVWYTIKEYRGTSVGLRLFHYMEEWARYKGCSLLQVGGAEGYSNVEKMYSRLGFTKVDSTFWRKL